MYTFCQRGGAHPATNHAPGKEKTIETPCSRELYAERHHFKIHPKLVLNNWMEEI